MNILFIVAFGIGTLCPDAFQVCKQSLQVELWAENKNVLSFFENPAAIDSL
jgi:hypothetical protein